MIDIVGLIDDRVLDTDNFKAYNIITTQIGSLYFEPDFGIDLSVFLDTSYNIQFSSFYAYVTDRLVNGGVDIKSMTTSLDELLNTVIMQIGGKTNGI